MQSLKVVNMVRFLERILLLSVGTFLVLTVMAYKGSAIPVKSAALNMHYFQDTSTNPVLPVSVVIVNSNTAPVDSYIAKPQLTPVQYKTDWRTLPVKAGVLVLAGILIVIGIIYIYLRIKQREISNELFP